MRELRIPGRRLEVDRQVVRLHDVELVDGGRDADLDRRLRELHGAHARGDGPCDLPRDRNRIDDLGRCELHVDRFDDLGDDLGEPGLVEHLQDAHREVQQARREIRLVDETADEPCHHRRDGAAAERDDKLEDDAVRRRTRRHEQADDAVIECGGHADADADDAGRIRGDRSRLAEPGVQDAHRLRGLRNVDRRRELPRINRYATDRHGGRDNA